MLTEVPVKFEESDFDSREVNLLGGFTVDIVHDGDLYNFYLSYNGETFIRTSYGEYDKNEMINWINDNVLRHFLELVITDNLTLTKKVAKLEADLDSLKNN